MPTYTLRVRGRFEAAHHLDPYRGGTEPIHGHSWRVEAELTTDGLDGDGLAFDFVEVKAALHELTARFDHQHINTVPPFDRQSPTTEHLAMWFFERLQAALPEAPLTTVTVWEGPDCSASYQP